jgi:hypothetical protein
MDVFNFKPGSEILVDMVKDVNIKIISTDVTNTFFDNSFYHEYIISEAFARLYQAREDNDAISIRQEELQYALLSVLYSSIYYDPEKQSKISKENLWSVIQNRTNYTLKGLKDQSFLNLGYQADILEYLAVGDWMFKQFSPTDRIYLFQIQDTKSGLPLVWMVISANTTKSVLRLHAWSYSLLTYFVRIFQLRDVRMYANFASYALGYVLNMFGNSFNRLYYSPYTDSPFTTKNVLDQLMDLANYTAGDENRFTIIPKNEDDLSSLGEDTYIELNDVIRSVYGKVDVRESNVKMCISCKTRVGTNYTQEYGRDVRFCGKECFGVFFLNQKE